VSSRFPSTKNGISLNKQVNSSLDRFISRSSIWEESVCCWGCFERQDNSYDNVVF
jgi:hypothetical protein